MSSVNVKQRIVEFIREYHEEYGYSPTVREITVGVGQQAANAGNINRYLDELEVEKWISRVPLRPRTVKVLKKGNYGLLSVIPAIRMSTP